MAMLETVALVVFAFLLAGAAFAAFRGKGAEPSPPGTGEYQGGVPLLCRLGLHAWRRVLEGQGRMVCYVGKCTRCEARRDEL